MECNYKGKLRWEAVMKYLDDGNTSMTQLDGRLTLNLD
jgi:hypothetical protein